MSKEDANKRTAEGLKARVKNGVVGKVVIVISLALGALTCLVLSTTRAMAGDFTSFP